MLFNHELWEADFVLNLWTLYLSLNRPRPVRSKISRTFRLRYERTDEDETSPSRSVTAVRISCNDASSLMRERCSMIASRMLPGVLAITPSSPSGWEYGEEIRRSIAPLHIAVNPELGKCSHFVLFLSRLPSSP